MGAYWPVHTGSEGTDSIVRTHRILTCVNPCRSIVIWDIKTGVIVKHIVISAKHLDRIVFSGHYTITLFTECCKAICTYDALDGTLLCEGELPPRFNRQLDAHWEHEDSLWFVTSYDTDENTAIDIHRLQPSSIPPFPTIESFVVPPRGGILSFSPVSFHASFVTWYEITVLDVRDSKVLLRAEEPQGLENESGRFSPDGGFFACGTSSGRIRVWKNTSTGYTTWASFKIRSLFDSFSFSPTAISILVWGLSGVELLDNHADVLSPNTITPDSGYDDYLMAHSKDGTRIATAWRGGDVITVVDPLSDAPERSINTAMEILDVGIVGNTVFATDSHEVVGWDPEVGEIVHRALCVVVEVIDPEDDDPCSLVTFTVHGIIFLYRFRDQEVYQKCTVDRDVMDIRSAPDGHQICFVTEANLLEAIHPQGCTVEQFVGLSEEFTEGLCSPDDPFSLHGCHIPPWSTWIGGDGNRKLLWLSPSWRDSGWKATQNGGFLVLVIQFPLMPIIIAFQPQLLLPPSHSIRSSDT